jgi:protocatechuate 3,4-dioxygenase, beta subunit
MRRVTVIILLALTVLTVVGARKAVNAQTAKDVTDAPVRVPSSSRIAPEGEPGTPLTVLGTVVGEDGKTPLAGVVVYAYHTDDSGHYRNDATVDGEGSPRLRGWAKTDSRGHFEFATIKPAPYPDRDVPAHIHVHAWGAGYPRQWFQVEFAGDPLLPKQHFTDNTADFLYIVPLAEHGGVWRGAVELRLRRRSNFPAGH